MAEDQCGGASLACPPFADTQNGIKSRPGVETVLRRAAHRQPTSFTQGLADRKVAELMAQTGSSRVYAPDVSVLIGKNQIGLPYRGEITDTV